MHLPLVCAYALHFNRLVQLKYSENSQFLFALIILPWKPDNMPIIQREAIGIQIRVVISCNSVSQ